MSPKISIRHSVVNKGAGGPDDSDIKQRGFYCVFWKRGEGDLQTALMTLYPKYRSRLSKIEGQCPCVILLNIQFFCFYLKKLIFQLF